MTSECFDTVAAGSGLKSVEDGNLSRNGVRSTRKCPEGCGPIKVDSWIFIFMSFISELKRMAMEESMNPIQF